ncbi:MULTISPECIES: copper chaperone PCu(A)C [unclassified Pseudonocardia]|uniref:copper chaperone PCu(A)C n=1 Tax=unclassified Pseudonocardia TaxID=2619320 RepID=UPI00094B344D|nr:MULTISPECIES: copper chaperone PCu(A)C [unclassified Pseudonocardia]OLM34081.1 putative lipoprotein [Pseudonocardia sp. Ae717_Ps2]
MSRTRRSARTLAGVAGAAALTGLLLSGCGTGQISQTSRQVAAVNGANVTVGSVDLRDVQIAYPTTPAGPDALYRQGGAAPLVATLVNTAPVADRLLSVTSPAAASVQIQGDPTMPQDIALVSPGNLQLSPTNAKRVQLVAEGLTRPVPAGAQIPMTFVFERAGSVTVTVPTGVPHTAGSPGHAPERASFDSEESGTNGAETGVNSETGGQAEAPPVDRPNPVPAGEGAPVAPGNEGSGAGGAAGN